jgi:hypothetical protein
LLRSKSAFLYLRRHFYLCGFQISGQILKDHHLPVPTRIDPLSTINIVKVKGNEYSSNSTPATTSPGSLRSSNGILITQYVSPQFEKPEAKSTSGLLKNIEVQDTSNGNSNKVEIKTGIIQDSQNKKRNS